MVHSGSRGGAQQLRSQSAYRPAGVCSALVLPVLLYYCIEIVSSQEKPWAGTAGVESQARARLNVLEETEELEESQENWGSWHWHTVEQAWPKSGSILAGVECC